MLMPAEVIPRNVDGKPNPQLSTHEVFFARRLDRRVEQVDMHQPSHGMPADQDDQHGHESESVSCQHSSDCKVGCGWGPFLFAIPWSLRGFGPCQEADSRGRGVGSTGPLGVFTLQETFNSALRGRLLLLSSEPWFTDSWLLACESQRPFFL